MSRKFLQRLILPKILNMICVQINHESSNRKLVFDIFMSLRELARKAIYYACIIIFNFYMCRIKTSTAIYCVI